MSERLIDLERRLKGKIPKGYRILSQGWSTKKDASDAAKRMRKTGYRARVIRDSQWYRLVVK